jgi:hypothetical protein
VSSPAPATSALVRRALARLDLYAALAGIVFGGLGAAVTAYAGARATAEIALSVLIGSVLYLVLRSRGARREPRQMGTETAARLRLVFNIVFVLALAANLLLSHVCWLRPQAYFVLMSVAAAAAAGEIFCSSGRVPVSSVLIKALLIAVTLRAGLAYEFPGFYGTDTWEHAAVIESWATNAHMTRFTPIGETTYYAYPVFHLFAVSTRVLSSLPVKDSMFLSASLCEVFSTLSVFVLVRRLAGERAGLLAALLAGFASFLVVWGAFMIPNALGTAIFAIILMLILKDSGDYRSNVLLLLMCGVLIVTHTVSSFATAVALAGMLVGTLLWHAATLERLYRPTSRAAFIALFWVGMLSYWMYAWFHYESPFFQNAFGWFQHALRTDVALAGVPYAASDAPLNRMFFLLFISFAAVGALSWLSQRERNSVRMTMLGSAAVVATTIVVFPIINIGSLLPGRWLAFAFLLAVGPMACGLLAVARLASPAVGRASLCAVLVFGICFFSVNNAGVNLRAPFSNSEGYYPYARGEMTAVDHFAQTDDLLLVTDRPFANEYPRTIYPQLPLDFLGTNPDGIAAMPGATPVYPVRARVYDHLYLLESPEDGTPYLPDGSLEHRVYANASTDAFMRAN